MEDFDWSFMGAVIVISLACFALIISVAYYCWLYEVASSFKLCFLSIFGMETKKSSNRKTILPVSTRDPAPYPTINRINGESTQRHVMQRVPQRPKHNNAMRRSNSSQNGNSRPTTGNSRPTTGNRQTRQRAVNIAIHDLKSQNHDQRENSPTKPAKSEAVRAYVKSTGASSSSGAESYSSTTITDNLMSTESESESEFKQVELEVANLVACVASERGEAAGVKEGSSLSNTIPSESYRTRKWAKMNRKLGENECRLTHVAEQLTHKPGRSTRAVAPYTLQESGGQFDKTDHVTGDHVTGDHVTGDNVTGDHVTGDHVTGDNVTGDHVTGRRVTGSKRRLDAEQGSILEVLQSLRKSGNLGINPIASPVSQLFTSDPEREQNAVVNMSVHTFKQSVNHNRREKETPKENSSASDEIKSSSDSDTESSLIVISRSPNFKHNITSNDGNNHEIEPDCGMISVYEHNAKHHVSSEIEDVSNATENPSKSSQNKKVDLENEKFPQNIDPSKQVFGRENTPDLDKRESLVRRIDSLFCSTTPSSIGSCISENVYEQQIHHNINNLNNRNYNSAQSSVHENKSSDDEIVIGTSESIFITQPNVYEPKYEEPITSTKPDLMNQSKANPDVIMDQSKASPDVITDQSKASMVNQSLASSSSSFNSTTLPSVTSEINTTTLDMSSEEENLPGS
ncbi:transcription initiation factor TFIID subunit 1-like [Bolinopsis microptera]|uniref:transcription initiation factor TFIID subunit 1-like n=1 Tax=Bolinopsis microptera TaxID=2820187 RepID=UPI003078FEF7